MALLTKLLCFSDPQGFRAQGHGGVMERAGRRLHNSSRHLRFLHVFPPPQLPPPKTREVFLSGCSLEQV